jgi:hypothetical protein
MEYVPVGVLLLTTIVIAELPEPGAGIVCGLNVMVVPVGAPDVDRATELLNPPLTVVVIVEEFWVPCAMLREDGEAEIVKVGPLVTVKVVVALIEPEAALMVEEPPATPVANPDELMVATDVLLELHVAEFVRSW